MKHSRSITPQLECLERRDLPSAAGSLLPVLVQPVLQEVSQLNAQVQQMNQDYSKLTTDISTLNSVAIRQDYAKLSLDLGNIQTMNADIQAQAYADQVFIYYLANAGVLNLGTQQDFNSFFSTSMSLTASSTQATQGLTSAQGIAAQIPASGFPSLDSVLNISTSSSSSSSSSSG